MSQVNDKAHLLVSRDEARENLMERMQRAADIKADDIKTNEELEKAREREKRWHDYNYDLLTRLFSTEKYAGQYTTARITQRSTLRRLLVTLPDASSAASEVRFQHYYQS